MQVWLIRSGRRAIKKKKRKKKQNAIRSPRNSFCPSVGGSESAYRVDFGVTAYQIPAEDASGKSNIMNLKIRRTWCLKGRVLWISEDFTDKGKKGRDP